MMSDDEIARLRAALAPFAEYAGIVGDWVDGGNPIGDACPSKGDPSAFRNAAPLPTLGDCRRAAQALTPPPKESPP